MTRLSAALSLFAFSVRQSLGERRLLLALVLLLSPAVFAFLIRWVGGDAIYATDTAELDGPTPGKVYHGLLIFMLLSGALPMAAMLYGPAAITAESENGTLVFLFTRRLRRYQVLFVRFVAQSLVLTLLGLMAVLAVHVVTLKNLDPSIVARFWTAAPPAVELRAYLCVVPWAAAAFLAVFAVISLITNKALVVSGLYLVMIEVVFGNLPVGARAYSISHPIRRSLAGALPHLREMFAMPAELADQLYPRGGSGASRLAIIIGVLLIIAAVQTTRRELSARRSGHD